MLRATLALSVGFLGLIAGTAIGGLFVPAGSGLAGPAIALGYGVVGALVAAGAAWIASKFATPPVLRVSATVNATLASAVAIAAALAYRAAIRETYYDPPSAFAGLPHYHVSVQRLDGADPVLAKRIEIDTPTREWALQLPDDRVCSGNLRAASQATVGHAIAALAGLDESALENCRLGEARARERLSWQLGSAPPASLAVSPHCRKSQSTIAAALHAIETVHLVHPSQVECR